MKENLIGNLEIYEGDPPKTTFSILIKLISEEEIHKFEEEPHPIQKIQDSPMIWYQSEKEIQLLHPINHKSELNTFREVLLQAETKSSYIDIEFAISKSLDEDIRNFVIAITDIFSEENEIKVLRLFIPTNLYEGFIFRLDEYIDLYDAEIAAGYYLYNEIFCLNCRNPFKNSLMTNCCKAALCFDCYDHQKWCPLCKCSEPEISSDYSIESLCSQIFYTCECGVEFDKLELHLQNCSLEVKTCPTCQKSFSQAEYVYHILCEHYDRLLENEDEIFAEYEEGENLEQECINCEKFSFGNIVCEFCNQTKIRLLN